MKLTQPKLTGSIAAALLFTCAASAQTNYLDAAFNANTFLAPSAGGGTVATNGTDTVDGIWRFRTGLGLSPSTTIVPTGAGISTVGGTVYESTGNVNVDNVPRVVTSVTGLSLNTYDVFVYFWSDAAAWRIRAGLTDSVDPLPLFTGGSGTPTGTPPPVQIATDTSNRRFWQAYIGQVTGTSFDVFVEDGPAANNNSRTWYDGIGYTIVPEPSSFALMGFAALGLLMKRKLKG